MITKIRVPAKWRVPSDMQRIEYETFATAEFSLGFGPCGKEVISLEIEVHDKFVNVTQIHADETSKNFLYRIEDLTGRVEIEHD